MLKNIFIFLLLLLFRNYSLAQYPSKLDTIQQTTNEPYNNICFLHIYREKMWPKKDGWAKSTGFFIAPNVILTAAHNIHSVSGSRVTNIKIIPGKYFNTAPYDSIEISGRENCSNSIITHSNYSFLQSSGKRIKFDFGIIILPKDAAIENLKKISKMAFILDSSYMLKENDTLNVAGYPADPDYGFGGDFITYQTDTCRGINNKTFNHNLDTYRGNSGSPIWITSKGRRVIIGIHTFGNAGTLLEKENINLIFNWLSQTKF